MSSDYERMLSKLENGPWYLSPRLFGNDLGTRDIYDFEFGSYIYFLDHTKSVNDLIEGLRELSPFADDALAVAECMSEQDFINFKLALVRERKIAKGEAEGLESCMPRRFDPVVLPKRILDIQLRGITKKAEVALGVALVRSLELKESD